MSNRTTSLRRAAPVLFSILAIAPAALGADDGAGAADSLFRAGLFDAAEAACRAELARRPGDGAVLARLGEILVLDNRLDDAERTLRSAVRLAPDDARAKVLLAETYARRDRFADAAPLLRAAGREGQAAQMEAFAGVTPYEIEGEADTTIVPFVVTDPLPIVAMRVNGGREAYFLLDTGGAGIGIDPDFADSVGATDDFGGMEGLFAGGRRAPVRFSRADSVRIGGFTVRNVPVVRNPVRLPGAPGGPRVVGVIGTVFLDHFLFTLDYPNDRLVLRTRTDDVRGRWRARPGRAAEYEVPFWMAGDHFIVAWGKANGAGPFLFLVDTGLAGGGFTSAEPLVRAAGIELPDEPVRGMGGGGPVEIYPYALRELSLGAATRRDIRAFHGAFPGPPDRWGFPLLGIISHGFFRAYSVTFDFDEMTITMKPGAEE